MIERLSARTLGDLRRLQELEVLCGRQQTTIWRKKCFGTDSEAGSRFVERIHSTVLSLRMQEREVFEFLVQAREAAVHGTTPPSLCPTT